MSFPQLIELIIFGGIAVLLVGKLISILGTTDDNDFSGGVSYFGEKKLKDVTNTVAEKFDNYNINNKYHEYLTKGNRTALIEAIQKIPIPFEPDKFIIGAKGAFDIVIKMMKAKNTDVITKLVDKRFINQLLEEYEMFASFNNDIDHDSLNAVISEVYFFGNSIFIKVLFSFNGNHEVWTFIKDTNSTGADWYLSNIENN